MRSATYALVTLDKVVPSFELTPIEDAQAPDILVRRSAKIQWEGSSDMSNFVLTGSNSGELSRLFDDNFRSLILKYPNLQLECKNQQLLINLYQVRVLNAVAASEIVEMVTTIALALEGSAGEHLQNKSSISVARKAA